MGAWIEISATTTSKRITTVAPHMGAWIEIVSHCGFVYGYLVAPHMGAWIEISATRYRYLCIVSHPTWVRGLKLK